MASEPCARTKVAAARAALREQTQRDWIGQMELNHVYTELYEDGAAVGDTVQFTASSAPESCIDPDHGMIYSTYLASRQNYGESRNIVALARIPVCQPERFTTWVVAESGMEIAGKKYGEFLDCNAYYYQTNEEAATVVTHFGQTGTLYRGYVRVMFLSYGEEYFYTDFDIQNETFSEIRPLRVLFHGEEKPLTGTLYAEILRDFGFTDFDLYKEKWEHVILTDKFRLHTFTYAPEF